MYKAVVHGICIGVANVLPGFSGATMAAILGIYERLMQRLSTLIRRPHCLSNQEWLWLLLLGLGVAIGVGGLSHGLTRYLDYAPIAAPYAIASLSLGSMLWLYTDYHSVIRGSRPAYLAMAIGAGLAVLFTYQSSPSPLSSTLSTMMAVGSGLVASMAMLMPGLSGALVLVLLGSYAPLLRLISTCFDTCLLALSGHAIPLQAFLTARGFVLLGFFLGALIGLMVTPLVITYALNRYRPATLGTVLGLILGGLPALFQPLSVSQLTHGFVWVNAGLPLLIMWGYSRYRQRS